MFPTRHSITGDWIVIGKTAHYILRHSGLDPWFDRPFDRLTVLSKVEGLTTLSNVEGESSVFWVVMRLDAPRIVVRGRILKSGMTCKN